MKMENQFRFLCCDELCYDFDLKQWKLWKDVGYGSNCMSCNSYRAARRHLRKHNEIPKGTKFMLCSKWVGFDRYLVKR